VQLTPTSWRATVHALLLEGHPDIPVASALVARLAWEYGDTGCPDSVAVMTMDRCLDAGLGPRTARCAAYLARAHSRGPEWEWVRADVFLDPVPSWTQTVRHGIAERRAPRVSDYRIRPDWEARVVPKDHGLAWGKDGGDDPNTSPIWLLGDGTIRPVSMISKMGLEPEERHLLATPRRYLGHGGDGVWGLLESAGVL
jgi:hypothetical protein